MEKKTDIFFHALILFVLFLVLLSLDHITKEKVKTLLSISTTQHITLTSFLNITWGQNFGIAFGLFNNSGISNTMHRFSVVFLNCAAITTLLYMTKNEIKKNTYFLYLVLIPVLAGAAGNIVDRLVNGYVFDFIDMHWKNSIHFPAFNLADIFISSGSIIYVLMEIIQIFCTKKNTNKS